MGAEEIIRVRLDGDKGIHALACGCPCKNTYSYVLLNNAAGVMIFGGIGEPFECTFLFRGIRVAIRSLCPDFFVGNRGITFGDGRADSILNLDPHGVVDGVAAQE